MADPVVQQIQQTQTSIPDYAKPYVEQLLGAAAGTIYNYATDAAGNVQYDETGMPVISGFKPYMQYQGDRIAQFSPLQQQAAENAALLSSSPQLKDAAALSGLASLGALNAQYTFKPYEAQNISAATVAAPSYAPDKFSAERVSGAYTFDPYKATQISAPTIGPAAQMSAASTAYRPELTEFQMGPAEQIGTRSVTEGDMASRYMSPYMQNVVDVQQREAKRQAAIAAQTQQAQAARSGAFGGGRDAIIRSQANADLQRQLAALQATGLQSAYQQGMQQFNAEQQAALQAAAANQQAGLTVGSQNLAAKMGVQQQRTNAELQVAFANLNAEQQARVQNQAAQLQMQGLSAQQALQASMANQQANQAAAQLNAQQGQFGANLGLQAGIANQQAMREAAALNAQQQQYAAKLQQETALANQKAALEAAAANQKAAQAAAELNAQQQQYGAGFGLQGLQTAITGAGQLANIGTTEFGQNRDIINLQNTLGTQQQQQAQNVLNTQYQDFLNAQNNPYRQIGFVSDLLRGMPLTQQSSTVSGTPPSTASQIAGLGTAALGVSKLAGLKSGGLAKLAFMKITEGAA